MSHKQDYQVARLLEDSISSLLSSTPSDPLSYLSTHFRHQRAPNSASHACFRLSIHPHTRPAFSDTCYEVYSLCRDVVLDSSCALRDPFLSDIYSEILASIPKEFANLLTSKLQLIPPSDFKSFERNVKTCYTYKIYIENAHKLYVHLCAGNETPHQEVMLEAIDTINGEFTIMRDIADTDKCGLVSLVQDLALKDAGNCVSGRDFVQMLATLFVETLK